MATYLLERAGIFGRILFTILVLTFFFISCSYDKIKTGIYYVKHDNNIEEYLIVKPDSTYDQFLVSDARVLKYSDVYYLNSYPANRGYTTDSNKFIFENYHNGFDSPGSFHQSSEGKYNLLAIITSDIFGVKEIIIDVNLEVYATKISQSYNSDSLLFKIENDR